MFISQKAGGYDNVPGIYSNAQVEKWEKVCCVSLLQVTEAVHKNGSFIYLQLWMLGVLQTQPFLVK
jgi:NADPH2 dehydrogenase